MSGRGAYCARPAGRMRNVRSSRWVCAPFVVAMLALFLQALIVPAHRAPAVDARSAAIADLATAIGFDAAVCVTPEASAPSAPIRRYGCEDSCPVCRLLGQSALLLPEPPSLPRPASAVAFAIDSDLNDKLPSPSRHESAQPRAPPLTV